MLDESFIKKIITIFLGIIITIGLSRECLFQPNIINV